MNFLGRSHSAQVVASIEVVPETLFFMPPGRCWLKVDLLMNGTKIGESKVEIFTPEELKALNAIVLAAVDRHHQALRDHGNL